VRTIANISIDLLSPETTVSGEHFCFHVVVSESEAEQSSKPTMKIDFSISRSFKVNYFRVTGKFIRYFMRPQNNIGFSFKGSKIWRPKLLKFAVSNHRSAVWDHTPRNLYEYPHESYTACKSPWATFFCRW